MQFSGSNGKLRSFLSRNQDNMIRDRIKLPEKIMPENKK